MRCAAYGVPGNAAVRKRTNRFHPARVCLLAVSASTASAGGMASNSTKRIVMKMDDGSVQYFDTEAAGLVAGDRIEITKDGTMRHPA